MTLTLYVGTPVSFEDHHFDGPADAYVSAKVEKCEPYEDHAAIITVDMVHGLFDVEARLIGSDATEGNASFTIRVRDRSDGELRLLAEAFHWIADQLVSAKELTKFKRMMERAA